MISNVKFLKSDIPGKVGDLIFWVKDTSIVVCFSIATKSTVLIGETPDSIIAFNISSRNLRAKDLELIE